jgi:hypothetical protein
VLILVGFDQHPDHQVLGRLVEHAASAGLGHPHGRPTIHASFLTPLLVMAIAFTLLFVTLHLAAMRNEILRRRVRMPANDAGAAAKCSFTAGIARSKRVRRDRSGARRTSDDRCRRNSPPQAALALLARLAAAVDLPRARRRTLPGIRLCMAAIPQRMPSALVGRPAPQTTLPALDGLVEGGRTCPRPRSHRTFKGTGDDRQRLGLLVRPLP